MSLIAPDPSLLPKPMLIIGNRRVEKTLGGEVEHVYAATGAVTSRVAIASAVEMEMAIESARAAFPAWRALSPDHRRSLLLRLSDLITAHSEELAALQTIESGVPCQFANDLPSLAADYFAYYAGWADKLNGELISTWPAKGFDFARGEPYGVVAVILPWNATLSSIGQTLGPALASGNTIVLKPSELAPFVALRIGELILKAGIPPGVVNVVPSAESGADALVRNAGIDKIHFTGSTGTGQKVLGAALHNLTPVTLELGGKSALLIFADADITAAVRHAIGGLVALSGQGCTNSTRVLVEESIYERVIRLVSGFSRRLKVGDPCDPTTQMGPLISARALSRVLTAIDTAISSKAGKLVSGGERVGGALSDGYFVSPTIFSDVDAQSDLAQKEIFGPVITFQQFANEEDAIRLANGTRYGLAAYLYTADTSRALRMSEGLQAGNIWINGQEGLCPSMPFGGVKQSGYGRLGGRDGIREFMRTKNVWLSIQA